MSGKKVSLIVTATIVLLCAIASASAAPTFTLTVQKGKLGTNTTFLPGETIVVNASYANISTLPYNISIVIANSTWSYTIASTSLTGNTTGYVGNGTGWLNGSWTVPGSVAIGKNYTIYINGNGTPYDSTNITFSSGINVTPTGTIQASNAVTFYVNTTAFKPVEAPVINLTEFGLGKVPTTYVTSTNNSNGISVYVYKSATVDLSKATYTSKTFSVKVCYTNTVNKTYTYSLNVTPNVPYQWVVLENTTYGVSQNHLPVSQDSAVPASLGANVINATEYIGVADKYGNVIANVSGTYTATIAVVAGPGSLNRTSITVDSAHSYEAVNVSVLTTSAPCKVTIQPYGSGLVSTEKTITFYKGISYLSLSTSKKVLYANNSDSARLYVALKDSNGDTIPLKGVNITVSEVTTLGLKFDGKASAAALTNASGVAVFTVTADNKSGEAIIRAVVTGPPSYPWNGKFGNTSITLLPAPNNTAITVVPKNNTTITAGVKVPVTITLIDYNDQPIKNCDLYPIKFNITSGDAKWLENNARCYEVTKTDANGNATATLYTTNATNNKITVVVSYKNEVGKWVNITRNYRIKANNVHEIAIYCNGEKRTSYAYPAEAGNSTHVLFTIKYLDEYGNVNTSSGTVKIVPQSSIVGNFSQATVSMTNGVGYVNFTTNASAPAGASTTFIFNDTTYKTGNVTFTILASGVEGVSVSANTSYPRVGHNVTITAQLLGIDNTPLAKNNVILHMLVLQPNGVYQAPKKNSTHNGVATFTFSGKILGKYIVKVYNATYNVYNTTTVIFVGPPVKLVLSANKTTVTNGSTVEFTVKTEDMYGMPSVPKNRYVNVLIDGILEKNISLNSTNAAATFNWTFNKEGTHTVYAMCLNNTTLLHDSVNITVTPVIEKFWQRYDVNKDGKIEMKELMMAINDWFDNKITTKELMEVINVWFES